MTLYARSDVVSVFVSTENGGCGITHRRPVHEGAPAKTFRLDCNGCENFLRADIARSGMRKERSGEDHKERYLGLWGATEMTIPETHDEEKFREHAETEQTKQLAVQQMENSVTTAAAMQDVAKAIVGNSELMAQFMQFMSGAKLPDPAPEVKAAPEPTDPARDQRECLDCGTAIVRKPGQKGALAQRCPDCKEKHLAARRKAA